eukprot:402120-Pelagomonas_calceolata.AAC.4
MVGAQMAACSNMQRPLLPQRPCQEGPARHSRWAATHGRCVHVKRCELLRLALYKVPDTASGAATGKNG